MTATVDIITNKKNNVIGVPISAIVIKSDTSSTKKFKLKEKTTTDTDERFECVFIKEGDEAKLRVVSTGIQDDSNIEITKGLAEGETVITGPYTTVTRSLNNGDKIEVKEEEEINKE